SRCPGPKRRGSVMHAASEPAQPSAAEPSRRRLIRALLYGHGVDRAAKAKARLGLAIAMFALGYGVIATRLIMFAAAPESHLTRRAGADAVATARPDILDRNGEILAVDVRMPSLFAEPQRIIDVDEAVEHLTPAMPHPELPQLPQPLS